jgi:hypothetical protein
MRLLLILFFCLTFPLLGATDEEVIARKKALDLAGAFSNDGYKIRDGNWTGPISTKEGALLQVNLYAGNAYWFTAGATDPAKKLAVTIFDETGKKVEGDAFQDGAKAAAGFSPEASGPYYIQLQQLEGEPATFCLIYSYK